MAAENSGHSGRPAPFGSLQQFTHRYVCSAGSRKDVKQETHQEMRQRTWLMTGQIFAWDDLRKILPGCQQMASVPNGVETLAKISIA